MRKIARPPVQPETAAYWQAADEGRLLVKRCTACGEFHHYPRDICPFCGSTATTWHEATGRGSVYSHSTMGSGDAATTIAYVTLDEGPTLLSNLVGSGPFTVGQRVRATFVPSDGGPAVPMFTPDGA